jgi:hypothetical protein
LHLNRKKFGLALALCALAIPVAALPVTASASPGSEKKQSKRISTINRNLLDLAGSVGSLRTGTDALISQLGSASADVATLKALSSALPPILTALGDGLKAVGAGLTKLSKKTQVAVQGVVGGAGVSGCFGETPELPITGNSVVLSMDCIVTTNGQIALLASCRSNKTNGGVCAKARIETLIVRRADGVLGGANASASGKVTDLGRNALVYPGGEPAKSLFPFSLQNTDAGPQDLTATLAGPGDTPPGPGPVSVAGASALAPAEVSVSIQVVDANPDLTDKAAVNS